ncbi:hypothetical protein [Paenibacillus sp. 32O-W]|uniref:hypothetical protein n=1 Tax=Paenibacillus sp. 32O-W TaxID=1695218 RepID=UPI0011AE2813|nr:hypothetical protein [Paenibacillus sp. 32O-W]
MGFALKKWGFRVLTKLQKRTEQLTLEVRRKLIGWQKALQQGDTEHSQRSKRIFFDLVQNSGLRQVVGIVISTGLKGLR